MSETNALLGQILGVLRDQRDLDRERNWLVAEADRRADEHAERSKEDSRLWREHLLAQKEQNERIKNFKSEVSWAVAGDEKEPGDDPEKP